MYTVNTQTKRIMPVQCKSFSELGLTERKDLQEWLANEPSALGEELLIIQKEFDGFDDTRERLDLLALDRDGNLVIIENKLDDSGRDVVWQALKYASYCASLTKLQVVEIFQQYLNRYGHKMTEDGALTPDAAVKVCDFLGAAELDEVTINLGNSQRIMLVAANFRKEVTSTALWLLGQGISVQCFKVTPHALDEQLLINIDQIIPTPEAKELMIGINAKKAEEKSTEVVRKNRHIVRHQYWEQALEEFHSSSCTLYNNISPSKDHWLSAGSGVSGCSYNLIFLQKFLRVELTIARGSTEDNKFIFDFLSRSKDKIDAAFEEPLEWLRLDDNKSSRIQFKCVADGFNKDLWGKWIEWHLTSMARLEHALKSPLHEAAEALKNKTLR